VLSAADDEVVPAFLGEDVASLLSQQGRSVTSAVLPGGHTVTPEMAGRARAWMDEVTRRGIRVSLGLPVDRVDAGAELVSGDAVAELAQSYERLGIHAAYVTDHPAPDHRWLAGGGHHALEPTVALAVAGAVTRRLLLHTNVYVLPYRNPFLAAKALASVDVLSAGRLVLGVAAGYLRPEFAALGADFDDRTGRLEEALELLPRIWGEEVVSAEGLGFDASGVSARPLPAQRPHPPIWVGGNSPAALRRAITHGQGWSPFPTPDGLDRAVRTTAITSLEDLGRRLVDARERCEAAGRTEPLTICFVPFSLGGYLADPERGLSPMVEEIEALEGLGVDWVALSVPGLSRSEVRDRAAGLAAALRLS
jgi:probable F420-dependent oxidoreductase